MASWVMRMIQSADSPAIALLMFIENVFPPIPSELIMPLAGYMASRDQLSMTMIILAGTLGSVLGALPLYYAGRKIREDRIRRWTNRYGRWMAMTAEDVERAQQWFEKYGGWTVFFCRLVPGIRSVISIPAGIHRMNIVSFLLWSTAGMAVWTTILTTAGYLLKSNFERFDEYLDPFAYVIFAVLVCLYIYRVVNHPARAEESEN